MMKPSVSVSLEWGLQQPSRIIEKLPPDEKYRTCCNCCHIKTGTVFLGLVELCAVAFLFISIVKQLMWKHDDKTLCGDGLLRDCLIFNFSHFNITLASDYIVALLMISIMLSILLLFYGIAAVSPGFLFPHIIVQAFGLLFSLGYFFLYAWSYFYGDLYTQKHSFELEALVERMWLASILLIFSAFQSYLFVTVIKCTLFLQMLSKEQKRRKNQFEEVSNRVRLAKENGLWRNTSWGGGFQQYRGQYDDEDEGGGGEKRKERKKDKNVNRVQWDLQKNEEKSISCNPDDSSKSGGGNEDGKIIIRKDFPIIELAKEPKKSAIKNSASPKQLKEQKSNSSNSADSGMREKSPKKSHPSGSSSGHPSTSAPRKTTGSSSPTRLHKTDSGGAKKHPPGDLTASPNTKRRRHKDSTNQQQQQQSQESPKSSHRPRREHQHHRTSGGNGNAAATDEAIMTGRNSPTKLTATPQLSTSTSSAAGGPIVKKISISSTPTFQQSNIVLS